MKEDAAKENTNHWSRRDETKIVVFGDAEAGHVKILAPVPVKVYVAKAHMTAVLQLIRYLG